MKNKTLIAITAFLIVFLFTIGVGVVNTVKAKSGTDATPTSITAEYAARELAYQGLIAEANKRIEQANQEIITLANSNPAGVVPTEASPYLFNPEQAAALAANKAGTQPEKLPELVSYSGTPAYEVVFSNGNIYIDANNGKLLYNGLTVAPVYITSDLAISIAANYLGTDNVTQIASGTYNGTQAYAISFGDGRIVYVDVYGNILGVQTPSTTSTNSEHESSEHDD